MIPTDPSAPITVTSQNTAILNHLRNRKVITHYDARTLYGCNNLRSRMSDLKNAGIVFLSVWDAWFINENGNRGRCKKYILK